MLECRIWTEGVRSVPLEESTVTSKGGMEDEELLLMSFSMSL